MSGASPLQVRVSATPRVCWAAVYNDLPVGVRVDVHNDAEVPTEAVRIRAHVETWDDAEATSETIDGIRPGATWGTEASLLLPEGELAAVEGIEPAQLVVEVCGPDEVLARATVSLEVVGWDHWCGPDVLPELLAAFCRPRHGLAADWLEPVDYFREDPLSVADRLRVLHERLDAQELEPAPPSLRLRTPDALQQDGSAHPLERALWLASALEAAGAHALVIVAGDAAAVGTWMVDHQLPFPVTDELVPLRKRVDTEEIAVISCAPGLSYAEAKEAGKELLEGGGLAVDIVAARDAGIHPLPTTADEPVAEVEAVHETHSARLERWKTRLLDLSMRNRLLNYRDTKRTLPLLVSDVTRLEDHLADGERFTFAPRVRTRRAAQVEQVEVTCPWCEARSVGALACPSCGGPLTASRQTTNPLAGTGLEQRLNDKVVVVDLTEAELAKRLLQLFRSARTQLEETGANTLYVAIGLLTYTETVGADKTRTAPLLLLPVQLQRKSVRTGYALVRTDEEPLVNPTLLQYLHQVHGFDSLALAELPEDDHGVDVGLVLARFRKLVEPREDWKVVDAALVTQLSFTRYMMWRDLDARTADLVQNPVVRQLLTDDDVPWPTLADLPSPEQIDDLTTAADVLCPMDADASQLSAILAAEHGHSFVLQGPPGTGKSQTITNLIAHALAHGRTVLFVSEKMAALEVVHARLSSVGLAPFCLELHSRHTRKSDVVRQLQEALDAARTRSTHDWTAHADDLQALRDQLTAYVQALHTPGPLGLTAYQAMTELVGFAGREDLPRIPIDLGAADALDAAGFAELREAATALSELAEVVEPATSVWRHVGWTRPQPERLPALRTGLVELQAAAAEVRQHAPFELSVDRPTLHALGELAGLLHRCPEPTSALVSGPGWSALEERIADWVGHARQRRGLWDALAERWQPALLQTELRPLHERFVAWAEAFVLLSFLFLFFARRRLATHAVGGVGRNPEVRDDLATALDVAAEDAWLDGVRDEAAAVLGPYWSGADTDVDRVEALVDWSGRFRQRAALLDAETRRELQDAVVETPQALRARSDLPAFEAAVARLTAARDALEELLSLDPACWDAADHLSALEERVRAWQDGEGQLEDQVAWNGASTRLRAGGLQVLLEAHERGQIEPEDLEEVLVLAVLTWWVDAWTGEHEALRGFHGMEHGRRIHRFRTLDAQARELAAREVNARLSARIPTRFTATHGEMGLLNRELRKKRRHLPTRKLFHQIPHVLQRIKPCVLMSPLSVAQYLDPALDLFDLVVFDEASQIPPWEAIGAMARGRQVVVVGDSKQLPPTSFFRRNEDDELDEEARTDLESILDECVAIGMPGLQLDWHYRSQHEGLITFSNRHYYNDRLITFPCARAHAADLGVRLHRCDDGVYDKGRTRTNRVEAEALVAEVIEVLSDARHTDSVGIVTFSMAQQGLIEDLLDDARSADPTLERWFSDDGEGEPVFVKNLENVQGDERDRIYFSVCYGPDRRGKVSMNFGPLNRQGGERRLNVALTRARRQLVMFSSLRADQIDLGRTSAVGVHHLRAFLQYAEEGADIAVETGGVVGPLVGDIAGRLEEAGYDLDVRVGQGAVRLDVAVRHPDDPERYVLGIETDGPAYAAIASARDRDRLRTEVLTRLGWHQHRVWAPEWLRHPERSWSRLEASLQRALTEEEPTLPTVEPVAAEVERVETGEVEHPTYVLATDLPTATVEGQSFYNARAKTRIVEALKQVLAVEAPVHLTELTRRVAAGWELSRITAKPRRRVVKLLEDLPASVRGDFVWRDDQDPATWTVVRVPGHARSADLIPPEEIAAAVRLVLRGAIASTRDDLARDAARLFGITRLGSKVAAAMDTGVDLLVARGVCAAEGERITLVRRGASPT